MTFLPLLLVAAVGLPLLAGCASFSADGGRQEVASLTAARIGHTPASNATLQSLLASPLTADTAVDLALLNNPALQAAFDQLGIAEADLVQAGRLRNPGVSFVRLSGGGATEIDRSIMVDIIGVLTLPARTRIEQGRFEQARLQTAAQAVQLAFETRQAFFIAVAAAQSASFAAQVRSAAEASSQLAERMAQAGNWSALDMQRERAFYLDALTQQAKKTHEALAAREQLSRLLGLSAEQQLVLPERLPALPDQPQEMGDAEARAMAQRLDLLAARRDTAATAAALGLNRASGFINVLDAGYASKSSSGQPGQGGYQVALELPLFDWGGAKVARAQARYMESVHRTADTALRARSEVREAYSAYRSSYAIARQVSDEVVPLRKAISDQVLLRYNGMLASVFELLADAREQLASVNMAIETQRDFWLADSRLQSAIHGSAAPTNHSNTRTTP